MSQKTIEVVLLDTDGCTTEQIECETLKEAKQRAKRFLTDEWAKTATEGTHTHQDLRTHKVEVRVNGECVWDEFYSISDITKKKQHINRYGEVPKDGHFEIRRGQA